jgi:hypothetical protein
MTSIQKTRVHIPCQLAVPEKPVGPVHARNATASGSGSPLGAKDFADAMQQLSGVLDKVEERHQTVRPASLADLLGKRVNALREELDKTERLLSRIHSMSGFQQLIDDFAQHEAGRATVNFIP